MQFEVIDDNKFQLRAENFDEVGVLRGSFYEVIREALLSNEEVHENIWLALRGLANPQIQSTTLSGENPSWVADVMEHYVDATPERLQEIAAEPTIDPSMLLRRKQIGDAAKTMLLQLREEIAVSKFSSQLDSLDGDLKILDD